MKTEKISEITGLSAEEIEAKIAEAKEKIDRNNFKIRKNLAKGKAGIVKKVGDLSGFEQEVIFVNSIIINQKEYYNVLINVPASPNFIKKHFLSSLDKEFQKIIFYEIPKHYYQGDIMYPTTDGKTKPRVIRHYFVEPNDFGRKIIASIEISTKVNLLTGEENVIINVWPNRKAEKPQMKMAFGVVMSGKENEYAIPETSSLCIRFDKIVPYIKPVSEQTTTH